MQRQTAQTRQAWQAAFDLTIRSSPSNGPIAWRINRAFNLGVGADDFGMVMHDALQVDFHCCL